jgi:guanylate kinase
MHNPSEFNPVNPEALLIVISGPSGVGKDSVLQELKQLSLPLHFVVNATTRPPRPGEVHGVDYFFISAGDFAEMIEKDELIEYALVYNDYKGIPKAQIRTALESGRDVVLRVDVQGARTVRKLCPDALLIFLTVDNQAEIEHRLEQRSTESDDNRKLRLATIRQELKQIDAFDYIIPNREGRLAETVQTIVSILRAEHHRVKPRKVTL